MTAVSVVGVALVESIAVGDIMDGSLKVEDVKVWDGMEGEWLS